MGDRTPAETLRAAAALVRETGSAATQGPWRVVKHYRRLYPGVLATVEIRKGDRVKSISVKTPGEIADAEWNALACPELAEPLADLIDLGPEMLAAFPDLARQHVEEVCDDLACQMLAKLRAVAKVLLGETP